MNLKMILKENFHFLIITSSLLLVVNVLYVVNYVSYTNKDYIFVSTVSMLNMDIHNKDLGESSKVIFIANDILVEILKKDIVYFKEKMTESSQYNTFRDRIFTMYDQRTGIFKVGYHGITEDNSIKILKLLVDSFLNKTEKIYERQVFKKIEKIFIEESNLLALESSLNIRRFLIICWFFILSNLLLICCVLFLHRIKNWQCIEKNYN